MCGMGGEIFDNTTIEKVWVTSRYTTRVHNNNSFNIKVLYSSATETIKLSNICNANTITSIDYTSISEKPYLLAVMKPE